MTRAIRQFLRDLLTCINAVNEARISAHAAKEQRPQVHDEHRGEQRGCGQQDFHFSTCNE